MNWASPSGQKPKAASPISPRTIARIHRYNLRLWIRSASIFTTQNSFIKVLISLLVLVNKYAPYFFDLGKLLLRAFPQALAKVGNDQAPARCSASPGAGPC